MNSIPYYYNDQQMEEIETFIADKFGEGGGYVIHELTSEYVHTDVSFATTPDGKRAFVTYGMGARTMQTPKGDKRVELCLCATSDIEMMSEQSALISSELVRLSKYPFKNDSWFGTGHTINASDEFKKEFGYDCFAFSESTISAKLSDLDEEINFLFLVPIYKEERDWCINNSTLALLEELHDLYDGKEFDLDFKREMLIPNDIDSDEIDTYNLLAYLNIDWDTYYRLGEYIDEMEKKGIEVDFQDIEEWVKKNK